MMMTILIIIVLNALGVIVIMTITSMMYCCILTTLYLSLSDIYFGTIIVINVIDMINSVAIIIRITSVTLTSPAPKNKKT